MKTREKQYVIVSEPIIKQHLRVKHVDSAVQEVFRKMASVTFLFVSSDLFDKVFADEQLAGNRQEDGRFPDIAEVSGDRFKRYD